jgi:hypothetical protein
MNIRHLVALAAVAACLPAAPALSSPPVQGEKLDSGLGELPHYSQWADKSGRLPMSHRVAGESLDSGLGELPHYSLWLDKSGRDPMGRLAAERLAAAR